MSLPVAIALILLGVGLGGTLLIREAQHANDRESLTITVCDKQRGYKGRYYDIDTADHGTLTINRRDDFAIGPPELYNQLEQGSVYRVVTHGIRATTHGDYPVITEATPLPDAQPQPCE